MSFAELVDEANGLLWSIPLVGIPEMIKQLRDGEKSQDGTSSFQSLMMSLANRVDMGNIGGVATAISFGGPGAVFWMWVMAFLGAATSFIERCSSSARSSTAPSTPRVRPGASATSASARWRG